ncbi:toprim domain-containing protein [Methyloversatilis discipulorum]|uniref:toprim domain-containing protein n=1 Tax=Methyloversatilis discipulorum TaxID=1119528 RepID=UPI003F364226
MPTLIRAHALCRARRGARPVRRRVGPLAEGRRRPLGRGPHTSCAAGADPQRVRHAAQPACHLCGADRGPRQGLPSTRSQGGLLPPAGRGPADAPLCVAEGLATAATIHEATGWPVAVAFDAGNLETVARELRALHADAMLIVCADDDHATKGNPGRTKAEAAAAAVGVL